MRVLLVDDEKPARDELKYILKKLGIDDFYEADSFNKAIELAKIHDPDVIFLDIELGSENGFDVIENIRNSGIMSEVVFVTAYESYAVKAFEVNAEDYIVKPFSYERVKSTIEKLKDVIKRKHSKIKNLKITAIDNGRIYLIDLKDILYFYSEGRNVFLKTFEKRYQTKYKLKDLEKKLDGINFLRTHKCYIVNLEKINEVIPWFNNTFILKFKGIDDEVPVSRKFSKAFKEKVLK